MASSSGHQPAQRELSTDIAAVLKQLKDGTYFFKVRGTNKWYRRRFHLDETEHFLKYDPSFKIFGKEVDQKGE